VTTIAQRTAVAGTPSRQRGGAGHGRSGGTLRRDGIWPWLFIGPLLAGIAVFYLWPIAQTAWFSLTKRGVFGGSTFVGVANYARLFADPQLYQALGNTFLYTGIVLLGIPIAVYLASLLNRPGLHFAAVYRVLYFMPYVAMPTAISMVWRLIFNGDFGLLNWVLKLFGVKGPYWIAEPGYAIFAVGIVGLWSSLGFAMIVFAAGLKNIPTELYEAAELDGATPWRQFRSITVPLLSPSIFFVSIISVIGSLQLFDLLFALLGSVSVSQFKSMSLVYLFYRAGFIKADEGYAAAVAMVIFAIIGLATYVQFRFQRRWVHSGN
jgi:multiple sugar transport system permease protein